MSDSDLRITIDVDASATGRGADQAKAAISSVAPQVQALARTFEDLGKSLRAELDGLGKISSALSGAAQNGGQLQGALALAKGVGAQAPGDAGAAGSRQDGANDVAATSSVAQAKLAIQRDYVAAAVQIAANGLRQQDDARQADLAKFRQEWDSALRPLVSSFTKGLEQMAEGTKTFGQVLKSLGQQILDDFVSKVVDPMLERWLGKELGQTAATIAGVNTRTAANAAGAAEDTAVTGSAALKDLMSSAAAAAGQAFKALAGIPVVGPALGAAAAAATFAGVLAFQGAIASAEGGFDVPFGVNPITQLHTREMVLPAHLADRVRALTANDSHPSDGHTTFNYTAHAHGRDTDDIERLLARHGQHVQRYIQNAARNNARLGVRRA